MKPVQTFSAQEALSTSPQGLDAVASLVARWRTASIEAGWRYPSDWCIGEVSDLADSLVDNGRIGKEDARALGAARAVAGVGLAESVADLKSLCDLLGMELGVSVFTALAEGWSSEMIQVSQLSCTDPATGLSTTAHFQRRVVELISGPGERTVSVARLEFAGESSAHGPGWAVMAELGAAITACLPSANSSVTFADGAFVAAFSSVDEAEDFAIMARHTLELELPPEYLPLQISVGRDLHSLRDLDRFLAQAPSLP